MFSRPCFLAWAAVLSVQDVAVYTLLGFRPPLQPVLAFTAAFVVVPFRFGGEPSQVCASGGALLSSCMSSAGSVGAGSTTVAAPLPDATQLLGRVGPPREMLLWGGWDLRVGVRHGAALPYLLGPTLVFTLHYITLYYITLHYHTPYDITLHHTTQHYIAPPSVAFRYVTLHYIKSHHLTVHDITLPCIT